MAISKPFYRIVIPTKPSIKGYFSTVQDDPYVLHKKYATNRIELCRAYSLLEQSLVSLFDYVEPATPNLSTFSHRFYELLLRASTEFETNSKYILCANGYTTENDYSIKDYCKIAQASHLQGYEVIYENWRGGPYRFKPFDSWSKSHPLEWYKNYNTVKHNREQEFELANLKNTIHAVAGVFVILFSQFGLNTNWKDHSLEVAIDEEYLRSTHNIFAVKPPIDWDSDNCYTFDWEAIKKQEDPFVSYSFK